MQFLNSTFGFKLLYLFGFINLFSLVLLILSTLGIDQRKYAWLLKYGWINKLQKFYGLFLKILIISIILHLLLAIIIFDNPWLK